MFGWLSSRPANVGISSLRDRTSDSASATLANCPASPNCVCSQADTEDDHHIEPFRFDVDPALAWETLGDVLRHFPRTQIIEETDTYLYAQSRTAVLRFCDDVELLMNAEQSRIDIRSASRWGYSDLGENRKRIERLRDSFQDALKAYDESHREVDA